MAILGKHWLANDHRAAVGFVEGLGRNWQVAGFLPSGEWRKEGSLNQLIDAAERTGIGLQAWGRQKADAGAGAECFVDHRNRILAYPDLLGPAELIGQPIGRRLFAGKNFNVGQVFFDLLEKSSRGAA